MRSTAAVLTLMARAEMASEALEKDDAEKGTMFFGHHAQVKRPTAKRPKSKTP
jgi:hypothetical protein